MGELRDMLNYGSGPLNYKIEKFFLAKAHELEVGLDCIEILAILYSGKIHFEDIFFRENAFEENTFKEFAFGGNTYSPSM